MEGVSEAVAPRLSPIPTDQKEQTAATATRAAGFLPDGASFLSLLPSFPLFSLLLFLPYLKPNKKVSARVREPVKVLY